MATMTPRTLSGFMELLPKPQQQMERMMEILRRTYALYGFTPLDTPVIEAAEVLLAKGGGETEKQIYRFQKGDADLALRFDLTVPLAKYVALHYNDLSFPFRRYQIGKVYRGERAQRGRFREFYQADIDIIGDGRLSITNEAEIPAIIYKTFSTLGLRRFQIRVNNRKILNGFYAMLGLTEKSGDVMRTVDKLDKIGPEKVKSILVEDVGVSPAAADEVLSFIAIGGGNQAVLAALEGYQSRSAVFDEGLEELRTVVTTTQRSAAAVASKKPSPRPAGASSRQKSYCIRTARRRDAICSPVTGCPRWRIGAVSKESFASWGWDTTALSRVQRCWATSEKSIRAASERPRAISRFRRPMSQSTHSTRRPDRASAAPTPAVKEVFPVPPLPDTTAIHCPISDIPPAKCVY